MILCKDHQKALGLPLSTFNFWTLFWTPTVWKGKKSHCSKFWHLRATSKIFGQFFTFFSIKPCLRLEKLTIFLYFHSIFCPRMKPQNLKCPSDIQISGSLKCSYLLCKRANGVVDCQFRISTSKRSKKFSAFFLVSIFCKKL